MGANGAPPRSRRAIQTIDLRTGGAGILEIRWLGPSREPRPGGFLPNPGQISADGLKTLVHTRSRSSPAPGSSCPACARQAGRTVPRLANMPRGLGCGADAQPRPKPYWKYAPYLTLFPKNLTARSDFGALAIDPLQLISLGPQKGVCCAAASSEPDRPVWHVVNAGGPSELYRAVLNRTAAEVARVSMGPRGTRHRIIATAVAATVFSPAVFAQQPSQGPVSINGTPVSALKTPWGE
jgi:hypothetical protein